MNTEVMFSSATPEWATPQDLFDRLNEKYHFNLDPASTDENAKCPNHYTANDDGLAQPWGGTRCFAIHHTAEKFVNGLRRAIQKLNSQVL